TTKGDLYTYSTTNDRLAVGNNGETLVADSSTSTGLRYQGNFAAGKNKIINGDFGIWQRGTSFTLTSSSQYTSDRWGASVDGTGACTVSRQTFTPGTAPVSGYESSYFLRVAKSAGTANTYGGGPFTRLEDVRNFANQTVTFSFWAKADSSTSINLYINQNFGSGGSGSVDALSTTASLTTSWQRFTYTFSMPSIAGKTIGTSSFNEIGIFKTSALAFTLDFWGLQLEAGSTATAFQTATGTIQGELAACQRYYERRTVGGANYGTGIPVQWRSSTAAYAQVTYGSPKRTNPSVAFSNINAVSGNTGITISSLGGTYGAGTSGLGYPAGNIDVTVASGGTVGYSGILVDSGAGTGYIEFSSEL
ncbi:MAG: carbohydrate binding domain-containing protein, partial [Pseudomonadota bacterium]